MPRPANVAGKALVSSVLQWCEGMQRLAAHRNDRRAVQHFDDCWCLVFQQFYGGYHLAYAPLGVPATSVQAVVPISRPRWFVDKYSRPLRRVLARVSQQLPGARNLPALLVNYDVLECKHMVSDNSSVNGEPPARHRRCPECPAKPVKGGHQVDTRGRLTLSAAAQ